MLSHIRIAILFLKGEITIDSSILANCTSGGCGAKIGPGELSEILHGLSANHTNKLIVGFDSSDDAAVYKMETSQCLISTIDFFPPMVDDPITFGSIAAANALSDIYAMGGVPILALNMVCFPEKMDKRILREILAGGMEKVNEAGAVIGGGHSIYDKELKYGLAVTGKVDEDRLLRNNTPKPGDKVILTKALGTGIIMAAKRVNFSSENSFRSALNSMQRLNKYSSAKFANFNVNACTDVTGFGLLAHALEMVSDKFTMRLYPDTLPILPDVLAYAAEYLTTAAGQRNRNHLEASGVTVKSLSAPLQELLFDPQTSGGLLISADGEQAQELLKQIQIDDPVSSIIGEITLRSDTAIEFV